MNSHDMMLPIVDYKVNVATSAEIYFHLRQCSGSFIPPLEETVDIREYSRKLSERSVSFEAWSSNNLIGLVAAYFNNTKNHVGYITNVSLMYGYTGLGIATNLMNMVVKYAKENNFVEIHLEVNRHNGQAIRLYTKFGFISVGEKNDMIIMKLSL